eukprot:TRINITY_DN75641_c0_g1_i1.p1 TRINITY_DN75641_c0_g1~~TRINITY_DN75641_c0_g1_i1.p1  ORF type:complete len:384 (+),score=57.31 TRINITY_DN75641_c0_g1_i1:122-1273(+)
MVKGAKAVECQGAAFAGKDYKDGIYDLINTTAARPSDFDQKAVMLFDVLEKHGRSQKACDHLKDALEGLQRDRVANWRGYIYTLLRGFDEEAYNVMKSGRRGKRDKRELKGAATAAAADGTQCEGEQKPLVAKHREATRIPVKSVLRASAIEFVPASQAALKTMAAQSPKIPDTKSVNGPNACFNKRAPEFVPGQPVHNVEVASVASRAVPVAGCKRVVERSATDSASSFCAEPKKTIAKMTDQLDSSAVEFVPGRPWEGASATAANGNVKSASVPPARIDASVQSPLSNPGKVAVAEPTGDPRAGVAVIESPCSVDKVSVATKPECVPEPVDAKITTVDDKVHADASDSRRVRIPAGVSGLVVVTMLTAIAIVRWRRSAGFR